MFCYARHTQDIDKDIARVQLHLRRIGIDSFRTFTLVAENSVTISAKDIRLHQSKYIQSQDIRNSKPMRPFLINTSID